MRPILFTTKCLKALEGGLRGVVTPSAGGGKNSAIVRVASIVPFLVIKGMALYDRLKEKDAWDIYFCLVTILNIRATYSLSQEDEVSCY
jgi:hypothetical protein